VLSLIALLLMGRAMNGSGGAVFVVLASLAAIGCAWQAALDFATALRKPQAATLAQYQTATAGLLLVLLEWCVARFFMPLSWLTPVVLAAAIISIVLMSAKFE